MKTFSKIIGIITFLSFFLLNINMVSTKENEKSIQIIKSSEASIWGPNKIPCFSSLTTGTGKLVVFCADCAGHECEDADTQGKCVPQNNNQ